MSIQIDDLFEHGAPLLYKLAMLVYGKTNGEESSESGESNESEGESEKESESQHAERKFTQRDLDKAISQRIAEVRKQSQADLDELEELRKEREERQAAEEERKIKELEDKKQYETILKDKDEKHTQALNALKEELDAAKTTIMDMATNHSLDAALKAVDNINPRMIRLIVEDLKRGVSIDEDTSFKIHSEYNGDGVKIEVRNDADVAVLGENGEPMTIPAMLSRYLKAYPEMLLATNKGGSGSSTTGGDDGKALSKKMVDDAFATAKETGRTQDQVHAMTLQRQFREQNG